MTIVDEPPTLAMPAPAPVEQRRTLAPWRLALRLARRETRRRPGRTALAAALIAIPVIAMTLGSVLLRTDKRSQGYDHDLRLRYGGTADVIVDPYYMAFGDGSDQGPVQLSDVDLPPGTQVADYVWAEGSLIPSNRSSTDADLRPWYAAWTDLPLDQPGPGESVEIVAGRAPVAGELLVTQHLAEEWGLAVGDTLELERPSGTWTIAGIGRFRPEHWRDVVVAPGFDRQRLAEQYRRPVTLLDLPDAIHEDEAERLATQLGGVARQSHARFDPFTQPAAREIAWGWVGGVLALVATGIIVAAAFATSARRQLVSVGQLAANGATPVVIRRTLALQGTWTAAFGTLGGIAIGIGSLPWVVPAFERWIATRDLPAVVIHVGDLLLISLTALLAGTIAAAVPARSLARVPVLSALAGRRPLGAPPRWLVPTGVALFGVGLGLLVLAGLGSRDGGSADVWALTVIIGAVAIVFGMVCATPLVVERAGRLARHAPLSPRLALRAMARSRTRSAAVVAAIGVATAAATVAGTMAEAALRQSTQPAGGSSLAPGAVIIQSYEPDGCCAGSFDPPQLPERVLTDAQREALQLVLPDAIVSPLLVAGFDPAPFSWDDPVMYPSGNGPWVATPELLDALGISPVDRRALAAEGAIVGRPDPDVWGDQPRSPEQAAAPITLTYGDGPDAIEVTARYASDVSPHALAWEGLLITAEHAQRLGFEVVARGALADNPELLTNEQLNRLYDTVLDVGGSTISAFVEPGDDPSSGSGLASWSVSADTLPPEWDARSLWLTRAAIVGAALLLVSLVVAIGLALAAVEGRNERDVLLVVGATPATMRRQSAVRAAVMAGCGIALGIPTGYLPTEVVANAIAIDSEAEHVRVPWIILTGLVLVVPLFVAVAAWLASAIGQRLRPTTVPHRN